MMNGPWGANSALSMSLGTSQTLAGKQSVPAQGIGALRVFNEGATMETDSKKVEDLAVRNRVDLTSCPFLSGHPTADDYFAVVEAVERETPDCVKVAVRNAPSG